MMMSDVGRIEDNIFSGSSTHTIMESGLTTPQNVMNQSQLQQHMSSGWVPMSSIMIDGRQQQFDQNHFTQLSARL